MSTMASQITGVSVVFSIICSCADQRNHQKSASLAFVRGIHQWSVNSLHKGPVTRKMFPLNDVIMHCVRDQMVTVIFKWTLWNSNLRVLREISLTFVPMGPVDNTASMVHEMAWRRIDIKPKSKSIMNKLTDTCMPHWDSISETLQPRML